MSHTFRIKADVRYIPVLLFDLLTWAGSSTCYVWDCQNAGRITRAAVTETEEIDKQLRAAAEQNPSVAELHPAVYAKRQIHFAACGAQDTLPRVEGMPADLFTACLLSPLHIALLFHNLETFPFTRSIAAVQVQRSSEYMAELWEIMSHDIKDKLWSELRAILHTIAWQSLGGSEYQSLVGQSCEIISNLASGFLLSQRVMPAYKAHPESIPPMSIPTNHSLWKHWDLILDSFFEQLPEYTAEGTLDSTWESSLQLVSFIGDQLDSILSTDQSRLPSDTRLPIICRAALHPDYRERACIALDAYLRHLDIRGLSQAIQGGALDVASRLMALDDQTISPRMISIWASLVRHDACVRILAKEGLHAERLTLVPAVKFFLEHLERNLDEQAGASQHVAIQSAAILSTIAQFVTGRQAPRFVRRNSRSASVMLKSTENLVQQWGALLIAEVKGSIKHEYAENKETMDTVKDLLISLTGSESIETRASAVYALSRWVTVTPVRDIMCLEKALEMTHKLVDQQYRDASLLVRKELVRLFRRVLMAGGIWTTLVIWICLLQKAIIDIPSERAPCEALMAETADRITLKPEQQKQVGRLTKLVRVLLVSRRDPDGQVAMIASKAIISAAADLRTYDKEGVWDGLLVREMPIGAKQNRWTPELLVSIKAVGAAFLDDWDRRMADETVAVDDRPSTELFERSKLSLQVYLAVSPASYGSADTKRAKVVRSHSTNISPLNRRTRRCRNGYSGTDSLRTR